MNKHFFAVLGGLFFWLLFSAKAYGQRDTVYFINEELRIRLMTMPDFDTASRPDIDPRTVKDAIYTENINRTHVLHYIDARETYTSDLVKDYLVTVKFSEGYLDVAVINSKTRSGADTIRLGKGDRVAIQKRNSDFFHDLRIQYLANNPGYFLIMEGRRALEQREKMKEARDVK